MTDVFIVSTFGTVRAGLAALLARADDLTVIGEAASFDAVSLPERLLDVDVVLFDAPYARAVAEAAATLNDRSPGLLALGPPEGVRRLIADAPPFAWGYLARDASPELIIAAVRAVSAGLVVIDPDLTPDALADRPGPTRGLDGDTFDELSPREQEVLSLVALGLTNKAIALRLAISDHTVKFHVAAVLAKLNAESRTEAVHIAFRRGLLSV